MILAAVIITVAALVFLSLRPNKIDLIGADFKAPIELFGENSDTIYHQFIASPDFNPLQGKKAVSLFSLRCAHCRKGAQQISIFARQHHLSENFLAFFTGREINVEWFYNTSESLHFPYRMMKKEHMSTITGGEVPQLLLLNDGVVTEVLYFDEHTEAALSKFFNP